MQSSICSGLGTIAFASGVVGLLWALCVLGLGGCSSLGGFGAGFTLAHPFVPFASVGIDGPIRSFAWLGDGSRLLFEASVERQIVTNRVLVIAMSQWVLSG